MYIYNLGLLFSEVAVKNQDRPALFSLEDNKFLSYKTLEEKSNRLTNFLAQKVKSKAVVLLLGKKHPLTFISLLACLKNGNVYNIFDPENPPYRLEKIIETCEPDLIIGDSDFYDQKSEVLAKFEKTNWLNIYTEDFQTELNNYSAEINPKTANITGNAPAYIMFTSGSTGTPKGAVMSHANVLNFIQWSRNEFNISEDDVFTNVNPLYFDNSVFDIYSSLFTGAALVTVTKEINNDPPKLTELIELTRCSIWFSVPSLLIYLQTMKAFGKNSFQSLRKVIFGGEGYPKAKLKKLFEIYKDQITFYNVYGPTECTCICSSYKISAADFAQMDGFPPLGKLIPNFSYLILNDDLKKVEGEEVGELFLIGPSVGLGYYHDPFRTEERFINNPYQPNFSEKMYKTGDLVKYSSVDDKIYILGRKDNQIKHMGYRIELEEIEIALAKIPAVNQAGVIHSLKSGFSRIKAIVELSAENPLAVEEIKKQLAVILPGYMIPTDFFLVEVLPKNPNGKVDKNKLKEIYS